MTSSALLRRVVDNSADAVESALKWGLLERVNDCVKELQLKCTSERSNAMNNDEATNSFLWVLEAVFIHGLNNSFLKTMSPFSSFMSSSLFSPGGGRRGGGESSSSSAVPNPSFWEYVLVFLHRDIIDQINSLHLIHTDVGRCRAWLRIALNEGLLLSFLENMTLKSNRRCMKGFYRSSAFLRDVEKCDILKNYLMGIELLDFRLVINNSFLNHWNSGPLSLVGLWTDENESVQQGVDVAQNIDSREFQAIPKLQSGTPPRFYSELESVLRKPTHPPLLSEDDALRIILSSSAKPPPELSSGQKQNKPSQGGSSPSSSGSSPSGKSPSSSTSPKKSTVTSVRTARTTTTTTQELLPIDAPSAIKGSPLKKSPAPETAAANKESVIPSKEEVDSGDKESNISLNEETPTPSPEENGDEPINQEDSNHKPLQQSTLSIESPVDERSYTDMLLKYQQRTQQLQETEAQCLPHETSTSDSSVLNTSSCLQDSMESHNSSGGSLTTASAKNGSTSGNSSFTPKIRTHTQTKYQSEQVLLDAIGRLELVKSPINSKELIMELLPRISKYTKVLATEAGLDTQNYACKMCGTSIGMFYGAARLCHFTGFSYCANCHLNQESVIPSRILLNWDFGLYAVCKQAHDFLEDVKDEPLFDVQEINNIIYKEIDECSQVKALRTKLFYIGMYLKTCKNTKALEEMKRDCESQNKSHLLDSIHMFSLSDLLGIPNRSLVSLMTKLVATGSGHILSCTICREKGFICEVCKKPQVIFPFELERIFKCGACGAVYHNTCMSNGRMCPRCERWKKNESVDLNEFES